MSAMGSTAREDDGLMLNGRRDLGRLMRGEIVVGWRGIDLLHDVWGSKKRGIILCVAIVR